MRKKSLLALLLAVMLLMSGCSLVGKNEAKDNAQAIIDVDGETINKQAFVNYLNTYGDSYAYYTIQNNETLSYIYQITGGDMSRVNTYYKDYVSQDGKTLYETIYENIANSFAQNLALKHAAVQKGMDQLTEEELAEVKAEAEKQYNEFLDGIAQEHVFDSKLEGDALRAAAKELVEKQGYSAINGLNLGSVSTLEDFQKMLTDQKAVNKLMKSLVSDEDVQNALNDAKFRMIKHILVMYGDAGSVPAAQAALDAAKEAAAAAQTNLDQPAEGADLEALKTALEEANAAVEAAQEKLTQAEEIKAKAEDVYTKATAEGADFDALMNEYSEDTGLASYPDGYAVGEGHGNFVQEFADAAMALENVGDVSEIVETNYGYHILRYDADATSESDAMNEEREEIRQEKLQEPLKALIDAAKVTLNLDKLN